MAVFIIGPLFGEVALSVVVAGALLLVFEILAVGVLLLTLRRYGRSA